MSMVFHVLGRPAQTIPYPVQYNAMTQYPTSQSMDVLKLDGHLWRYLLRSTCETSLAFSYQIPNMGINKMTDFEHQWHSGLSNSHTILAANQEVCVLCTATQNKEIGTPRMCCSRSISALQGSKTRFLNLPHTSQPNHPGAGVNLTAF